LIKKLFQQLTYKVFAPGVVLRKKYEAFKELLISDSSCHELMAWIQEAYHGNSRMDLAGVNQLCDLFSKKVNQMIQCLNRLAPDDYVTLADYHRKFDFYIRFLLTPPPIDSSPPFVLRISQVIPEAENIGNKALNLARIQNELGGPVPPGFIVTTNSYHYFIDYNNLRDQINTLLTGIVIEDNESLNRTSKRLKKLIMESEVPEAIRVEILNLYNELEQKNNKEIKVAVRSSAAYEDGDLSFAGQYLTLVNVDQSSVVDSYRQVLASKYSPQALYYRINQGLFDEETPMSVLVLAMVDAHASGVLYSQSPFADHNDQELQHLHVVYGQGELLVGGKAKPDIYTLTRDSKPHLVNKQIEQPNGSQADSCFTDETAKDLGDWGMRLEKFFGAPQDIEWAVDEMGKLSLLQSRPLQTWESLPPLTKHIPIDPEKHPVILNTGQCGSRGFGSGTVYMLTSRTPIGEIPTGSILVTQNTPPEYVQIINRLAGVIAEKGSTACHFATVAREFGVPLLVDCPDATQILKQDQQVTIDAENVNVYNGSIESISVNSKSPPSKESLYHKKLGPALSFIIPLKLIDPTSKKFIPESCRSMHDIIRFVHEKSVQSMFSTAKPGTGRGAIKLQSNLPLEVFLFDVGGGLRKIPEKDELLTINLINCTPFLALWQGLSHPGIRWKNKPFDWDNYDKIVMAGGIAPKQDDFQFSSYGVVSKDYLHLNMRFGYHFTIVDIVCGDHINANYCMLRFAGGGGDFQGRSLRLQFLSRVLQQLGFTVEPKADLLEAKINNIEEKQMCETLDIVGRLLGATKIMDMVLKDEQMVAQCVTDFFNGQYNFSKEE